VNLKPTNRTSARVWRFGFCEMVLATGMLVDERIVAAPSVISSQAPTPPLTTDWQQNQPDEMDVFGASGEPAANQLPQFLRYGPLWIRPHADYRFMYGNGLQATAGNQQASAIHELAPGLLFNIGSHWSLDYTPTLRFYSNKKFRDTVDHALALTGGLQYADWVFGFSHSSQFTTTPLAETGSQTEQATHATGLTASHAFTGKISADFGLNQQINLVTGFQDSYTWSTLDWVNYQFWPRLSVGLGGGGGYVMIENRSQTHRNTDLDQTFEQLQARINWRATQKISFQVSGGLEDRQFSTAGSGDSVNPIFGASVQYQPFQRTRISLSASRTVSSSDYYLAAQQSETTSIGVNLDQRLLKKFNLGLGLGYAKTDFNTSAGVADGNRADENVSFNARLSHPFFKRGTWSLFYQFSDNRSSQPGYGFQSNQTGFEISYRY
jgi:hypothetical protein